jgi:hypothetical protein
LVFQRDAALLEAEEGAASELPGPVMLKKVKPDDR